MNRASSAVDRFAAASLGGLAALLLALPAMAGDEDISPSAYQQFDPVTGYVVTVDPNADADSGNGQKGHGTAGDSAGQAGHGNPGSVAPAAEASHAWLYWAVVAAAGAAVLVWLRRKMPGETG